jgi:pre-rRNA-processing protein IPI1
LQLQTSSALSHIFPEIRLDAARLVHLFLEHIPKHITSSWPTSDSTILEGLRLTVGLGGDKGVSTQGGRLGAQGKLVTLRTILAFLRRSLGYQSGASAEEIFGSVFGEMTSGGSKGKGKARQVGEHGLEEQYEGFLAGCSEWGLEEPSTGWEIGRIESTSSLSGKEVEIEALTVSNPTNANDTANSSATLHSATSLTSLDIPGSCSERFLAIIILILHVRRH